MHRGQDVNNVRTNFAQCGLGDRDHKYTLPYCTQSEWGAVATKLNHHVSVKATMEQDGRVIRIYRCPLPQPSGTCPDSSPHGTIKVTKAPPHGVDPKLWFPIWNRGMAGKHY